MDQEDIYPQGGNGIGDACDCEGDFDCDQDVDGTDAAKFKEDFGRSILFKNPCPKCSGVITTTITTTTTTITTTVPPTTVHKNVRKALIHRFPYGIFYIEGKKIVAIAFFHAKRDSKKWRVSS